VIDRGLDDIDRLEALTEQCEDRVDVGARGPAAGGGIDDGERNATCARQCAASR